MMQQLVEPGAVLFNTEVSRLKLQGFAHREKRIEHQFLGNDTQKPARFAVVGDDVVTRVV